MNFGVKDGTKTKLKCGDRVLDISYKIVPKSRDLNSFSSHNTLFQLFWNLFWVSSTSGISTDRENNFSWSLDEKSVFLFMFHPCWGFQFDLSIGSKYFSFHVSIFLLLTMLAFGSPSKKKITTWKLKMLLTNWKVLSVTPSDKKNQFFFLRLHFWKNLKSRNPIDFWLLTVSCSIFQFQLRIQCICHCMLQLYQKSYCIIHNEDFFSLSPSPTLLPRLWKKN